MVRRVVGRERDAPADRPEDVGSPQLGPEQEARGTLRGLARALADELTHLVDDPLRLRGAALRGLGHARSSSVGVVRSTPAATSAALSATSAFVRCDTFSVVHATRALRATRMREPYRRPSMYARLARSSGFASSRITSSRVGGFTSRGI